MKKIISLFQRNYDGDRVVRDDIVPGAEWVIDGEGYATVKYDGTACMVRAGKLFKRYDTKKGKQPPPDFEPAQDPDPYQMHEHRFIRHGSVVIVAPRTFQELKTWFQTHPIEGVVWHHPDGRMVKIKRKDFGLPWPVPELRGQSSTGEIAPPSWGRVQQSSLALPCICTNPAPESPATGQERVI